MQTTQARNNFKIGIEVSFDPFNSICGAP